MLYLLYLSDRLHLNLPMRIVGCTSERYTRALVAKFQVHAPSSVLIVSMMRACGVIGWKHPLTRRAFGGTFLSRANSERESMTARRGSEREGGREEERERGGGRGRKEGRERKREIIARLGRSVRFLRLYGRHNDKSVVTTFNSSLLSQARPIGTHLSVIFAYTYGLSRWRAAGQKTLRDKSATRQIWTSGPGT